MWQCLASPSDPFYSSFALHPLVTIAVDKLIGQVFQTQPPHARPHHLFFYVDVYLSVANTGWLLLVDLYLSPSESIQLPAANSKLNLCLAAHYPATH